MPPAEAIVIFDSTLEAEIRQAAFDAIWTYDDHSLEPHRVFHGTAAHWRFLLIWATDGNRVNGTATSSDRGTVIHLPEDLAREALTHAEKNPHSMMKGHDP